MNKPLLPITLVWPMVVTARPDSMAPGDSSNVAASLTGDDNDMPGANDPGHPNRPHPGATLVSPHGDYLLFRLRRDQTFHLALHLLPRSGFEVVSGPAAVLLSGNVTGQDFVIRKISTP